MKPFSETDRHHRYETILLNRSLLSKKSFEVAFEKPAGFTFIPGQRIRFIHQAIERDYSLVSAPGESTLRICVREVKQGGLSPVLASMEKGTPFAFSGPHGYFTFHASPRPPVFVATGTGIAPFVSMAVSGIRGYILLHGVSATEELYYADILAASAREYIPCISNENSHATLPRNGFGGRVTAYLEQQLLQGAYEFYLCGSSEMIRDVTFLADDRFEGSYVHSEMFY